MDLDVLVLDILPVNKSLYEEGAKAYALKLQLADSYINLQEIASNNRVSRFVITRQFPFHKESTIQDMGFFAAEWALKQDSEGVFYYSNGDHLRNITTLLPGIIPVDYERVKVPQLLKAIKTGVASSRVYHGSR